ncbi:hypothetical protein MRX96_033166 [Rhipicephalus microplus]
MGKRKWNVLHSRLKVLTKLEIKALKKENQSWLSSLKTIPLDDPSAVADAIMKAVADKRGTECRRRACVALLLATYKAASGRSVDPFSNRR